jgi:hypothetical protein
MRKRVLLGGLVLLLAATVPVLAGPNGGGSIIVHTNDAYAYKSATACTTTLGQPVDCVSAVTQTDVTNASGYSVLWFLAAFVPTATPNVATVYFGHHYDVAQLGIEAYGPCGTGTQIPDATWPFDDDTGTSWGFTTAQTATLFRFYVFQVYELTPPAATGAYFCSDVNFLGDYASFISPELETDVITRFGCIKWYEAGSNSCPVPPPTGACCLNNTACTIVSTSSQCTDAGGTYQGDNTICDKPCSACCYWAGQPAIRYCVVTTETDCTTGNWSQQLEDDGFGHTVGSTWSGVKEGGVGHECATEPSEAATKWFCQDPRQANATKPTTWGQLKAIYR